MADALLFKRERIDGYDKTFCLSWGRDISGLTRSIAAAGQINPLIVRRSPRGESYQLVHGFLRLQAMELLGQREVAVAALEGKDALDRRAFEIAFWDNLTTRGFNLVEAAMAIKIMMDVALMDEQEIRDEFLPAMGFERSEKIIRDLAVILELEDEWLAWIVEKNAPLGTATLIRKVTTEHRPALLKLFHSIRPGRNVARELIPLLAEIAERESITITQLLNEPELEKLCDPELTDRNQRQADVMKYLRDRKGQGKKRILSAMTILEQSLDLPPGVSMKKPSRLDPLTIVFQVEGESGASLKRRFQALAAVSRSEALARFFWQWG